MRPISTFLIKATLPGLFNPEPCHEGKIERGLKSLQLLVTYGLRSNDCNLFKKDDKCFKHNFVIYEFCR